MTYAAFARDLARRLRRPRLYPPPPWVLSDALEQLCGGGPVAIPVELESSAAPVSAT